MENKDWNGLIGLAQQYPQFFDCDHVNFLWALAEAHHALGDSARTFTATITLGQALEAAKSTDPEKIRTALQATNVTKTIMPWQGIKFDSRGQNTQADYLVLQLIKNDWQVVYPKGLQSANLVWPMPSLTGR